MFNLFRFLSWCAGVVLMFGGLPGMARAETPAWVLRASIERAQSVSPALQAAEAEVNARVGERRQAGSWPNPTLEVRADEKLGIEDGRGGVRANHLSLTQPIPFWRMGAQRRAAEAAHDAALAMREQERLCVESQATLVFYRLQFAAAPRRGAPALRRGIAQRPRSGGPISHAAGDGPSRHPARECAPGVAMAEGKWSEAVVQFNALLDLPPGSVPETIPMSAVPAPPSLETLLSQQAAHPALRGTDDLVRAGRARADLARAQRTGPHFADIRQLLAVLHRLRDHGNTVVVIEHNLDVIKTADWVIDLGPEGGDGGGTIVCTGTPEDIAAHAGSHTSQFLKPVLAKHSQRQRKTG
jgi:hypothetical protein